MKSKKIVLFLCLAGYGLLAGSGVQAQDPGTGHSGEPEEKWNVTREYDEQGNLIYYDSSYSRTWEHFDGPEFGDGHPFGRLDSLFGDFFHFPHDPFDHHSFSSSPFSGFMDSLDTDWFQDSTFLHQPHGFAPFNYFQDSSWSKPFFPDSLFPDAFIPFEDFLVPDHFFFHPPSFHDPHEFFERYRDRLQNLYEDFSFPEDSIRHFEPEWQQGPRHQKNALRGIEI